MSNEYTLTQKELTGLRSKLTRAQNSKDPKKVIATVDAAFAVFEAKGYPDQWSNWQRAKDDATFELQRSARMW